MSGRERINDRYELEEPIARGGMGEVWFGRDIKLEREVAVKFVRFPDGGYDKDYVRRFVRESKITARLEHPGVPAVYDVGTHKGRPYLVMQRIRGISVADLTAEHGPLPIGWAAAIAAQVCSVLSAAHRASLVHRDLKPSNLMLEPDGTVKVLDFGLAVAPTLTDFSRITHTGQPLGTPAYMAPEQIEANYSGPATDLYALGCTLHEMLSGERLFTGSTSFSVMTKQVRERPTPLRRLRADVPADLERLVLHLLEKKPDDRPNDADVVYQALLPFVTELKPLPGALNPPSQPSPVRMYAGVVSRAFPVMSTSAQTSEAVSAPSRPIPTPRPVAHPARPRFSRDDLSRARSEANHLVRQSRYRQAAEVLASAIQPASRVMGSRDPDVLEARLEHANLLFEGGDYRAAAPAYAQLAIDLADTDGPGGERVLHCRMREATCHALLGETRRALQELSELLRDEIRLFSENDPRVIDLRRQIGLLQFGAGQRHEAWVTLSTLRDELVKLHDPAHPAVAEIDELLKQVRPDLDR